MARDEIEVTAIVFNSDIAIALNREMEVMESESKERKQEFRDELMGMPRWLEKTEPDKMREQTDALMSRSDGKEVCAYLRNIRIELAQANNISFESEPCSFTESCAGTCAKCDQEAAYLRDELNKIPEQERKYPEHILTDWKKAVCSEK